MKCLSAFRFHLNMAIRSTWAVVSWIALILNCLGKVENIKCGFENGDVCGWTNDNFTVTSYRSPLQLSGPVQALEGTYYAYFYGSTSANHGAVLEFPFSESDGNCLFLAYHMWGSQMGSLSVVTPNTVKQITGDQGNMWHCVGIELSPQGPSTVEIRVVRGTGPYSIVGIDDVRIFSGNPCDIYNCTFQPAKDDSTTPQVSSLSTSLPVDITTNTRTTTTQGFFKENLPLIVGIPGGLLVIVIIAAILIVSCRRNKQKEEDKFPELMMQGQHPSGPRTNRYRSFPNNKLHQDEEVYDEIKEGLEGNEYSYADTREALDNKGYLENESVSNSYLNPIDSGYLTPKSVGDVGQNDDPYLKPRSRQDKGTGNPDENYTILPAITLPIDKVNANHANKLSSSTMSDGYVEAKNLNIPHKPGKKISISDQGDVMYFDISKNVPYKNVNAENTTYLSLSHMKS